MSTWKQVVWIVGLFAYSNLCPNRSNFQIPKFIQQKGRKGAEDQRRPHQTRRRPRWKKRDQKQSFSKHETKEVNKPNNNNKTSMQAGTRPGAYTIGLGVDTVCLFVCNRISQPRCLVFCNHRILAFFRSMSKYTMILCVWVLSMVTTSLMVYYQHDDGGSSSSITSRIDEAYSERTKNYLLCL